MFYAGLKRETRWKSRDGARSSLAMFGTCYWNQASKMLQESSTPRSSRCVANVWFPTYMSVHTLHISCQFIAMWKKWSSELMRLITNYTGKERLTALSLSHFDYDVNIDTEQAQQIFASKHPRRLVLDPLVIRCFVPRVKWYFDCACEYNMYCRLPSLR